MPEYGLVQLLALEEEHLEIIELEVGAGSPAAGQRVRDVVLPDGSLIISVLRDGAGFVPKADSVIEAGDQVLLILDPGLEGDDHAPLRAQRLGLGQQLGRAVPGARDRADCGARTRTLITSSRGWRLAIRRPRTARTA